MKVFQKIHFIFLVKFHSNFYKFQNMAVQENFKTDIENSIKIKKNIPDEILVISESGINNSQDINYLTNHNINNFLIGESLMRSKDISGKLKKLVNKE